MNNYQKKSNINVLNIASIKYELYLFVLNVLIKLIHYKKNLFFLSILSLLLTNFSQVKNINIETQQVKSKGRKKLIKFQEKQSFK